MGALYNLQERGKSKFQIGTAAYLQEHLEVRDCRPIRTTTCNIYRRFTVHLTLMMTSVRVVETSVNVTSNGPQDCTHPDDHNLPN